jgi:uncharacterized protein (TIGR00251 family)
MDESPLSAHPEGALIRVWAVPRASRSEIKGVHDGRVKVRVMSPPEAGKANDEVLKLLEERLGVDIEQVGGTTSRDKLFLARGIGAPDAAAKLIR